MKIVLVNTMCGTGSIGRICVDLYETVMAKGQNPYIVTGRGELPPLMEGYKIGNNGDFVCHVLKNFFEGKAGFGSKGVTKKFLSWLDEIGPDVIHIHNTHGFYLDNVQFFDYLKKTKIPTIWTLHDCWSFTGHCAYFDYIGCEKWKVDHEGCHDCPIHKSAYPYALFKDNTKWNYKAKRDAYTGVPNLTIVTPSHWLAGLVKQSYLKEYPVEVIHNGINLDVFAPLSQSERDKNTQRNRGYGHMTILGVANRWEERKGLKYFEQLVDILPENYTIELIGLNQAQKAEITKKYPMGRIVAIDRTKNAQMLAAIYRTADAYVNATMEDNFPTTNLEALACGTPVITFDTGGSKESLTDKCGVVVPKGDVNALSQAIRKVCEEKPFSAEACRKQAMNFDRQARYQDYLALYERVTKKA